MSITIGIAKETLAHEKRVSVSPETVKKLTGLGIKVSIEKEAGQHSAITDHAFKEAGGSIVPSKEDAYKDADVVLCVQGQKEDLDLLKQGAFYIGLMFPYQNDALIKEAAKKKIHLFSMELVPRITRAQSMDVLSSQSNLAGYKAVLDSTEQYARALPMMMTAAGTVPPAKIFVMGAGVAGLQAIATAKRLGAVVSATDVRPAAKEQVQSLGGSFIAVEDDEFKEAESTGGYAKQMSTEYQTKQAALIEEHIAKQDIVITTALIPGKPAPKLITKTMVESMRPGSVILDMAVENGGNCDLSKPGKVVVHKDVSVIGHINIPSRLAASASALYAKNLFNLINLCIKDENIAVDWDDDIIKGIALTKDGTIIHPDFAAPEKKTPAKSSAKGSADASEDAVTHDEPEKKTASNKD